MFRNLKISNKKPVLVCADKTDPAQFASDSSSCECEAVLAVGRFTTNLVSKPKTTWIL